MQIRHYLTSAGRDPYQHWLDRLKDLRARVAIQRRIDRLATGNFGDHKACRDGVWELRVDFGPGYRVYYAKAGSTVGNSGERMMLAHLGIRPSGSTIFS